jgi:hypothetical protein
MAARLVSVLVVGFDTATPAVSVAVHDGDRVVAEASAARTLCGIVAAEIAASAPVLAAESLYPRRPDAREPGPPKRVTPS